MIIELSQLKGIAVRSATGEALGSVDFAVFNGKDASLFGFQIVRRGVVKKFAGLHFADLLDISRNELTVENAAALKANLRDLDEAYKNFGPVVGVTAATESGIKIGKVADLYLDLTTGGILRYYVKNLLQERLIPCEFLVAITPERVIFKDIVAQGSFEKAASAPATTQIAEG